MNAKQFIIDVYERYAKAVENGYDLRMEESEWLVIMEEYADHKLDMARKNSGNFTNGSFTLAWEDVDRVRVINNRIGKYALICGGDLEGMFNALIQSTPYKIEPEWNTSRNF